MNLQRIACDILNLEDIALTMKQTNYLESVIKQRPGIEQQALETAKFLDYKSDSMYNHIIQELRKDETLVAILSLSVVEYSDLINIMADVVTGDFRETEYELEADIEATKDEITNEDPIETDCLPAVIQDFLNAPIIYGEPVVDHDSYYTDGGNRPLNPAYIRLLRQLGKRIDDAVWLKGDTYEFASKFVKPNSDSKYVFNEDLLHAILLSDKLFANANTSQNEMGVINYLKFWLGDYYEAASDFIKNLYGMDLD